MGQIHKIIVLLACCSFVKQLAAADLPSAITVKPATQRPTPGSEHERKSLNLPQQSSNRSPITAPVSTKDPANEPAAHQPGKQPQHQAPWYHGTQQLLVLSTISFLPLNSTSLDKTASWLADSDSSHNKQQTPQSQIACVNIKAVLSSAGPQWQQLRDNPHAAAAAAETPSTSNKLGKGLPPPDKDAQVPIPTPAAVTKHDSTSSNRFQVCRHQRPSHMAGATQAAPPEHRVVLLVPLQPHGLVSVQPDVSSEQNLTAAAQSPVLLTLYVEQHLGGQAYLWAASKLIAEGQGMVQFNVNMRQSGYSWTLVQPAPPTGASPSHNTTRVCSPGTGLHVQQGQLPAAQQQAAAIFPANSTPTAMANANTRKAEQQQLDLNQTVRTRRCPTLQQLLQAHAAWGPAGAAYAVATLLGTDSRHAEWTAGILAAARTAGTSMSSTNEFKNEDSSRGSRQMCSIWLPRHSNQDTCKVASAAAPKSMTNPRLGTPVPVITLDGSSNVIIRLSQQQLMMFVSAFAAAVLLLARAFSIFSDRPGAVLPAPAAVAAPIIAPQQVLQHASQDSALCAQQCEIADTANHCWVEHICSASGDPFGYGSPAAAALSYPTGPAGVVAATTAERRASAMAAGHAAGTLKDAFANRAAGSTAAKANVAYWDNADEEAVNQLPASIQAHLQAAGRWTRDRGGRLVRGSMHAMHAASTMAAAALTHATGSGGATAVGADEALVGHGRSAGKGVRSGDLGNSNGDAALLQRLVVAGPGTELVLSDDEA